jgi:hypothetical protein
MDLAKTGELQMRDVLSALNIQHLVQAQSDKPSVMSHEKRALSNIIVMNGKNGNFLK